MEGTHDHTRVALARCHQYVAEGGQCLLDQAGVCYDVAWQAADALCTHRLMEQEVAKGAVHRSTLTVADSVEDDVQWLLIET